MSVYLFAHSLVYIFLIVWSETTSSNKFTDSKKHFFKLFLALENNSFDEKFQVLEKLEAFSKDHYQTDSKLCN